jgi:hypothetical protein
MATGGRRVEAGMIAAQAQKGLAEEPCAQNEYQCKRERRGSVLARCWTPCDD